MGEPEFLRPASRAFHQRFTSATVRQRDKLCQLQWQKSRHHKRRRPLVLRWKPATMTMVLPLLPPCVPVFSVSLTACTEVQRRPRISCRTFGYGGSLLIEAQLRTRLRSWRRRPHDCVSTSPSPPNRAVKPTSGRGFPNPWTPAAIPD